MNADIKITHHTTKQGSRYYIKGLWAFPANGDPKIQKVSHWESQQELESWIDSLTKRNNKTTH